MKIEVHNKIEFSAKDKWHINLHSFYNLVRVLYNEIQILQNILGQNKHIQAIESQLDTITQALENPYHTEMVLKNIQKFKSDIFSEIEAIKRLSCNMPDQDCINLGESISNISLVMEVAEVRTDEFLTYFDHRSGSYTFYTDKIIENLKDVFQVMSTLSHDKYEVTFDGATHTAHNYFIDLQFPKAPKLSMPILFPDVMRDLIANAKKYSSIGGTISCTLESESDKLIFTVHDNGRGIPKQDIKNVVDYKYRGSNVTAEETNGNGFGLTKAYLITKINSGRMWLDSVENEYTTVTIELPISSR